MPFVGQALEQRVDELEVENQRLREQAEVAETPDSYEEFLSLEFVQSMIEDAKADNTPRYVKGVVAMILRHGGEVTQEEIATNLGIKTTSHVAGAIKALEQRNIVTSAGTGDSRTVDFDTDSIDQIREQKRRQEATERLMEQL